MAFWLKRINFVHCNWTAAERSPCILDLRIEYLPTAGDCDAPMDATNTAVRTEIRGLEIRMDGSDLLLSSDDRDLTAPVHLNDADAERLRLEMAKARLPEWNQLEQMKARAELRYRRYLGSWLVMCLAAFSAYVGYPGYALPIVFSLLSIFLWWRAGHEEQRAEREAQAQLNAFRAEWEYIRQRLEEEGGTM